MKIKVLLLGLFSITLLGCRSNQKNASQDAKNDESGPTKVVLNMSNFSTYISCTKYQGFTGPSGFSPYMAWFEFKGLLSIGVYDVAVTYTVGDKSYDFKLDISGGGKTDYFDRNVNSGIVNVTGTVTYRI